MNNTKLLVVFTFLIFIFGFSLLWFGTNPQKQSTSISSPSPSHSISIPLTQVATKSAVLGIDGEKALVTKVVDGDTIYVQIGGVTKTVRFIGIDTPETVDPRRPVGCFGKEASNKTKEILTGKEVILQKDVSDTDKYSRILRYIFLPLEDGQMLFVNDYLVREGYAKVLTYPPDVKYNERFREAEREARLGKKGLWDKC
jgi:micrococcal nuclease